MCIKRLKPKAVYLYVFSSDQIKTLFDYEMCGKQTTKKHEKKGLPGDLQVECLDFVHHTLVQSEIHCTLFTLQVFSWCTL